MKENKKIPTRPVNPPNLCEDCGGYRVRHMQGKDKCECLLPHGIAWKYLDNISSQSPLKEQETKQRLALAKDIESIVAQTLKYSTSNQAKISEEQTPYKALVLALKNSKGNTNIVASDLLYDPKYMY